MSESDTVLGPRSAGYPSWGFRTDSKSSSRRAMPLLVMAAVTVAVAAAVPDTAAMVDSSSQIAARIIESKVPVIVDFWAPWCKPCHIISPVLEQIARQYKGRAKLVKINIDIHQRISSYFGVMSIPAVYFVRNKVVRASLHGARTKEEYRKVLEEVLAMKDELDDSTAAPSSKTSRPDSSVQRRSSAAGDPKEK